MRLFVALSPPPDVNDRLISAVESLRAQGSGRFTQPENLHMTLVFIGETKRPDNAVSAINSLSAARFTMTAANAGCFGDLYWLGMQKTEELSALQGELETRLREVGFAIEEREFIPHITLARRFVPDGELDLSLVENAVSGLLWPVNTVTLMESRQEDGKSVYLPLYTRELAAK